MPAPLGNKNNAKGRPITEAVIKALHQECDDGSGKKTKRLYKLADTLVKRACEDGDMVAIREVLDRVEGKPSQALQHSGPDGGPIQMEDLTDLSDVERRQRLVRALQSVASGESEGS